MAEQSEQAKVFFYYLASLDDDSKIKILGYLYDSLPNPLPHGNFRVVCHNNYIDLICMDEQETVLAIGYGSAFDEYRIDAVQDDGSLAFKRIDAFLLSKFIREYKISLVFED